MDFAGGAGAQSLLFARDVYDPVESSRSSVVAADEVERKLSVSWSVYSDDLCVLVVVVVVVETFRATPGCTADAPDAADDDLPT